MSALDLNQHYIQQDVDDIRQKVNAVCLERAHEGEIEVAVSINNNWTQVHIDFLL